MAGDFELNGRWQGADAAASGNTIHSVAPAFWLDYGRSDIRGSNAVCLFTPQCERYSVGLERLALNGRFLLAVIFSDNPADTLVAPA